MVKVKIIVIDKNTKADITDTADVTVTNQETDRTISVRQDGYYHLNYDVMYNALVTVDHSHYVSYGLIYNNLYDTVEERLEV